MISDEELEVLVAGVRRVDDLAESEYGPPGKDEIQDIVGEVERVVAELREARKQLTEWRATIADGTKNGVGWMRAAAERDELRTQLATERELSNGMRESGLQWKAELDALRAQRQAALDVLFAVRPVTKQLAIDMMNNAVRALGENPE